MPANGFNVGRDVVLDIIDPVQGPVRFKIVTGWDAKPVYTELTSKALDGVNRMADIPERWDCEFMFDRADSSVDSYFAAQEDAYFNGQVIPTVQITETITNADGTLSQFRYTDVAMRLSDGGSWKADAKVEQRVSARARRRLQVA